MRQPPREPASAALRAENSAASAAAPGGPRTGDHDSAAVPVGEVDPLAHLPPARPRVSPQPPAWAKSGRAASDRPHAERSPAHGEQSRALPPAVHLRRERPPRFASVSPVKSRYKVQGSSKQREEIPRTALVPRRFSVQPV